MNLLLLDRIDWDYDAQTPYLRPLGGSQSALCYLTVELAARGHNVSLFTATTRPRQFRGVNCANYESIPGDVLAQTDALIVVNSSADTCLELRPHLPANCRLILWTQHAHNRPANIPLSNPKAAAGWDAIVCVSQWHADKMRDHYHLDARRLHILRNAVGPAFLNLFPDQDSLAAAKSNSQNLAYTSTPYRGLDLLLSLFPQFHNENPLAKLRVYSSMNVYFQTESTDPHAGLYRAARSIPGVDYVGSIPQPALAAALKNDLIFAYPNKFPETSCISVMEAMAAGLLVITSDLGALPETAMGHAILVPGPRDEKEIPDFLAAYTRQLTAALGNFQRNPQEYWQSRWAQIRAVTSQYTWPLRAADWENFLTAQIAAAHP